MIIPIDKARFLDKCYSVSDKLVKSECEFSVLGNDVTGKLYSDELIYIAVSNDKSFVEVERKTNKSPLIFVENGEVILFSSDYIYLEDHIESLLK